MRFEQFVTKILSVSKIGKLFSKDPYALENYEELEKLSIEMLDSISDNEIKQNIFVKDIYPTPNVSVRVMVFDDQDRLLMVKEKTDGAWSVPGGWCDLYLSSSQNGVKEVYEESGLNVKIEKLLGVFQRELYKDYKTVTSDYVHYYSATIIGGNTRPNHETDAVEFFDYENLPQLSFKNTKAELDKAYSVYKGLSEVQFD